MKKNKLLTPLISFGVACTSMASIATITSCSCSCYRIPDPIPSKHGFDVEGKEYKIEDDNSVSFKITCKEKDNHTLSNIELLDGDNKLSVILESKDMKNGEVNITFKNVILSTDLTNNAKIVFNVDDSTDSEEIARITISKNVQPGPQPTKDIIVSGVYGYKTEGAPDVPPKPDDYVVCKEEEINFYDMADWYANASDDTNVVGNMLAYDMVCFCRLWGDPSSSYSSEVTYNFTQKRMTATIRTEKIEELETSSHTEFILVNVPYWLTLTTTDDGIVPVWTPIGSPENGFIELWSYDDWSIKMDLNDNIVEVSSNSYDELFNDMSANLMSPCLEAFQNVKIKPFEE